MTITNLNDEATEWVGFVRNSATASRSGRGDFPLSVFGLTDRDGDAAGDFSVWLSGEDKDYFFFSLNEGRFGDARISLYSNAFEDPDNALFYTVQINARGTAGGVGVGDGSEVLTHSFVVAINGRAGGDARDIDMSQRPLTEDDYVDLANISGSLEIAILTNDEGHKIDDIASLELSFDNNHWWFVVADEDSGAGYIFFDNDGDTGTDNDVILLLKGDDSILDTTETDFSDDFTAPTDLAENGALTFDQFLALLNIQAGDISFI